MARVYLDTSIVIRLVEASDEERAIVSRHQMHCILPQRWLPVVTCF